LKRIKVILTLSLFDLSVLSSGEGVVVGARVSVGATFTSAVLVSGLVMVWSASPLLKRTESIGGDSCVLASRLVKSPTPTAKNNRIRVDTHTQRIAMFTVFSRMVVGSFIASPFFFASLVEKRSLARARCLYEEKPKERDIPQS